MRSQLPSGIDNMSKSQTDPLETLVLVFFAINSPCDTMSILLSGFVLEDVQGAILKLHIELLLLDGLMVEP